MDARSAAQRIVAILVIVGGVTFPVFADSIYTYSGDFNLSIPSLDEPDSEFGAGWMDDAIIEVPDHFIISDLDIAVTLTHENLFDLQVILQSPEGTNVALNASGNMALLNIAAYEKNIIFDDEAELPIEQGEAPFTGRFRPTAGSLLQVFDGQDSFGLWRLQIYDAWEWDTGTLNRFELTITAPEPTTVILLLLGTGLVPLFKPRRS